MRINSKQYSQIIFDRLYIKIHQLLFLSYIIEVSNEKIVANNIKTITNVPGLPYLQ